MVFDINYILNLKENYNKVDLPNDFLLFNKEYIRKTKDLDKNKIVYSNQTSKSKPYYKSNKPNKIQKIVIRDNNAWYPTTHSTAKNIVNIIKVNLNKLTTSNFNTISNIIVNEILQTNINIIDILTSEIIRKNTYDKEFQNEYIKLCEKIWNLKLYNSFTKILYCKENKKYYCKINTSTQSYDSANFTFDYIGPFKSDVSVIEYLENKYSFKKQLLNKLYTSFKNRYNIYNDIKSDLNLKEEDIYKKKREVYSVIEFITKLYLQNLISFNIIYLIHIDLLIFNTSNIKYKNYDIELLYNIWNLLKTIRNQSYNSLFIGNIYNILHYIIEPFMINTNMEPRILFFVNNIQDIIKLKFNIEKNKESISDFTLLIDNTISHSEEKNSDIDSDEEDSDEEDSEDEDSCDENSYDEDSENEDEDIEDIILSCIKKKEDLYNLITSNDITTYTEVLLFVTINNKNYITSTVSTLHKLINNNKISKLDLDSLMNYGEDDLNEFALDNYKVHEYYSLFKEEYNNVAI